MSNKRLLQPILQNLTILLILLALAFRVGAEFEWLFPSDNLAYSIIDIQQVFPKAHKYTENFDKSITVRSNDSKRLGNALVSADYETSQYGYNGLVPLIISTDLNHTITNVSLLRNNETAEFIDDIYNSKLLTQWDNLKIDSTTIQKNVDAVSGATYSSDAIISGVRATLAAHLKIEQSSELNVARLIQLALMLSLITISLIMVLGKKLKKYYTYYLLAVLLVFGFITKKMLSLDLFHTWLQNGLPWYSNWEIVTVLFVSLLMVFMGKGKYYCNYLCPMGALQMLVSKISPFKQRSFPKKVFNIDLRVIYLSFIWASLLMGFTLPLSNMEPFMAFTFSVSSWIMIASGLLIVVVSLFFKRPWCALCPTGCALNSLSAIKTKK